MLKLTSYSLLPVLYFWALPAFAQIDETQFRTDLTALTAPTNRIVGSDGYYAAARFLEEQIASLPNVELRRHEFDVMVPVTQAATLTLSDGSIEPVYPFWPASVRVK